MTYNYSVSSLKLHQKYPRLWALIYIEKLGREQNPAIEYGSKIHNALESAFLSKKDIQDFDSITNKVLNEFVGTFNCPEDCVSLETKFYHPLVDGMPPVVGVVDLWWRDQGVTHVYDHKTCSSKKYCLQKDDLVSDWQLCLYVDALCGKNTDAVVGHNQFFKDKTGLINSFRTITNILTADQRRGIIEEIKQEMLSAEYTRKLYEKYGLRGLRPSPEHKMWYGRPSPYADIINENMTVEEYRQTKQFLSSPSE